MRGADALVEVRRRVVAESGEPIVGTTGARFPSARLQRRWRAETPAPAQPAAQPADQQPPVAAPPAEALSKRKGRARGARFPSEAMLRRWEAEDDAPPADAQADDPDEPDEPDSAVEVTPAYGLQEPAEPVEQGPRTARVRPYVLTSGRTRPDGYLGVETLVSARPATPRRPRQPMPDVAHRAMVELCARPRSVAEVAALMEVPLGVARVLIGDLSRSGVLRVHRAPTLDGKPDLSLMSRVLDGLRQL